jgi:Rad3-related DNA helicase
MINQAKNTFATFVDRPFRPNQREAIEFVHQSDKRVVVLESPTGSGKSLMGAVAGRLAGDCAYLVHSKSLQIQITNDFPEFRSLFGRSNYTCGNDPRLNAAECSPAKENPCGFHCEYFREKQATYRSPLRVLNYAYFLTEANYVGKFSGRRLVICDEADTLEGILTDFISLKLNNYRLKNLGLKLPKLKTATASGAIDSWKDWAKDAMKVCFAKKSRLDNELETMYTTGEMAGADKLTTEVKKLSGMINQLSIFVNHVGRTWLRSERETKFGKTVEFAPVWLTSELTEQYLLSHGEQFLLMSATLPPPDVLSRTLGIPFGDIDYMRVPSTFDPAKCPTYLENIADLSYKKFDGEIAKAVERVYSIIASHPQDKGVVHTASYKVRNAIMNSPLANGRIITHDAKDRMQVIDRFLEAIEPLVLVSPSCERGISLDGDRARFSVIVKAPFQSLADKKVAQRAYTNRNWYASDCVQAIIQSIGRGIRSADDWCTVYILDVQVGELLKRHAGMFSQYFRDAVR